MTGQSMSSGQPFEPVPQIDEARRQADERDRNGSRPTAGPDEHHGINLASIGEDNNYEDNMSNGQDEADMTSEQVDGNHENNREGDGEGGAQRSPSPRADDNISEDDFDECEGSQATNGNVGVGQNDNINLANEDQAITGSQQNAAQRTVERR